MCVFRIRAARARAAPCAFHAAGCAAAWIAHQTTHDPLAACSVAIAALALSCFFFDRAALSPHLSLRWSIRGAELAGGILIAVFLAWSCLRAIGGAEALSRTALVCLSAAILGGLAFTSRYRAAA